MEFFTINQYFNKLYSVLLSILLFPIALFCILFIATDTPFDHPFPVAMRYVWYAIVFTDWIFVIVLFNKKIRIIRNVQGLGMKLQMYYRLTIVRYALGASGGLALAIGYFLTGDTYLTILFVSSLLVMVAMWPRSGKVCHDLKLKGDEREMVYFRKDQL